MKRLLLLIFTITISLHSAQSKAIKIGDQDYAIVTETYNIYSSKGKVMKLYKKEHDGKLTYILGLTLRDITGTCSIRKEQRGAYEINGTDIKLYSFWDRDRQIDNAPYGARIVHYKLLEDQTIVKKASTLYIESARKNYDDESGMKYLFQEPKTDEEKALFKNYIMEMENTYKGKFVFDNASEDLIKKVKNALERKMRSRW